jgi:hypothetical protein
MIDELDVFHGQVTDELAQVYVRHRNLPGGGEYKIRGRVHGPYCDIARTIPNSVPLRDLAPGETLLARADIPEPCTWSPDLPAQYEVEIELMRGGECVASESRRLGIRRFGPRGKGLYLSGRRYVLRGIHATSVESDTANGSGAADGFASDLETWRECGAAIVIDNPSDDLCDATSRHGVMIVARIDAREAEPELRRLSRWASVGIVWIEADADSPPSVDAATLRAATPNVVLAQSLEFGSIAGPAPWAQLAICDIGSGANTVEELSRLGIPAIASRKLAVRQSLEMTRSACDALQRDLALAGLLAGYIV